MSKKKRSAWCWKRVGGQLHDYDVKREVILMHKDEPVVKVMQVKCLRCGKGKFIEHEELEEFLRERDESTGMQILN